MEMDMQKKWRHHLENIMQYVIKKSEGTGEIPFLFREKMCKAGLFSFFYCRGWHIYGAAVWWNKLFDFDLDIGSVFFLADFSVFKDWKNREYEMLEAQVLAIKGKHYPCRNYQVIVQDKAGKSIRIWIPKESILWWERLTVSISIKWSRFRKKQTK